MDIGPNLGVPDPAPLVQAKPLKPKPVTPVKLEVVSDDNIGKRFEQMLWAEMLSHAGLEESLTQGGGEAVAAFSRYVVEAIAEDIAEKHPLGLTSAKELYTQSTSIGGQNGK